jgi:hypothetical protein
MIMEERLNSHYEALSRSIEFTRTADAKAAPVLALQIAILGALAARFEKLIPALFADPWCFNNGVLWVVLIAFVVFMFATVLTAARVYMPMHPRTGESLIYFEDIAAMRSEEFVKRSKEMSSNVIEEQLLSQIHIVSQIASAKMRRVRWAFWLSGPSLVLGLILLACGSVRP